MPHAHTLDNSPSQSLLPQSAGRSSHRPPDVGASERAVDRLLSYIAGFYGDEWLARHTAEQIRHEQGLTATQLVLLSPQDAPRKQFERLAMLWAGHWPAGRQSVVDRHLSAALLGAAALLLAAWATVLWSDDPNMFIHAPTLGWLSGCLGLGLVTAWLSQRQHIRPHVRRFKSRVQQQLAQGHWAVVVCKLPWAQQADVLAQLRAGSLRWCAVAEPTAKF